MCSASFSGARARHPQQPSTDELGPDSLESLALIANRFLSSQQGIAQQKLKDAQAVADNSSLGHKDAAAALAQINSNWFEKMRQAYDDTNNELIKVVITLSPRQADLAVTLWKGHMVIQTTLMDGFVCVFQAAVKGFLEKIGPVVEVLKKAYQMIKDILVLARQKTQKVFGGEPTVLPHSDKLPKGLEEDTKW